MRVNLADFLRETAAQYADDEALAQYRDSERLRYTWSEFDRAVDVVTAALSAQGLVAGNRVGLIMVNSIDLAIAYFAVLRRGLVAVPMNPRSGSAELQRMLADAKVRIVLADEVGFTSAGLLAANMNIDPRIEGLVTVADTHGSDMSWHEFKALGQPTDAKPAAVNEPAPADPEALAVLLYTSVAPHMPGSDGQTKAAMLTHRALIANIEQLGRLEPPPMTQRDSCLVLLPLFHIYGLNAILGQAVARGTRCVVVDGFDPDAVLELIHDENLSNIPIAPPVIAAWAGRGNIADYLGNARQIVSGSAALDQDLMVDFERSCGKLLDQGYGLTEAGPIITTTLARASQQERAPLGSVGRPLPGIQLQVREPAGMIANIGDPAEIWVRGDNLFSGYWPDGLGGPGRDGWFATGDIGYLDQDGMLTVIDRVREVITVSGFSVYPREVEEVIEQVPGVGQVAVVGVPDQHTTEAIMAYVVPHDGGADSTLLQASILEHCRKNLARFKHPHAIVIVEHLPASSTGKVAKGRLRALGRSRTLGLEAGEKSSYRPQLGQKNNHESSI